MKVGILKEIKDNENRIALTPQACSELIRLGNDVYIEKHAYIGSGYNYLDYTQIGVTVCDKSDVFCNSDLIVKVKEPQISEVPLFSHRHTVFSYLHLAAEPELTSLLLDKQLTAIAFETVTVNRTLPLLAPMSEIAGKLSIQNGCCLLHKHKNGKGILLGGLATTERSTVMVLGYGVAGKAAANLAADMGANVLVFDTDVSKLHQARDYSRNITALYSSKTNIEKYLPVVDLLIGAVLIPGAKAPRLITNDMKQLLKYGTVVIDIAIDQGGCIEDIQPTNYSNPMYVDDNGIIYFAVTNMPGAVPRTASEALSANILPYVIKLTQGEGVKDDFFGGVNLRYGEIVHPELKKIYEK